MDTTEAVKQIKQWASDNYENGGDVIVEAFEDAEIIDAFIDDTAFSHREPNPATTVAEAVKRAQDFCGVRKEYADDIRASAW